MIRPYIVAIICQRMMRKLSTLTSQRQDFADLGIVIPSFDFFSATITDLLCIFLYCQLIVPSYTMHLEFFFYLRT